MNLFTRLQVFISSKTNAALDRAEDPRQTLDYAYGRQQELLHKVKRGLIEVATSRRQLELQAKRLRERVPQFEEQARRALAAGREDLARLALQRKQTCLTELAGLERQLAETTEEEGKLTVAQGQFASRVETFRARRETLTARYTAAEAQVRVHEALSGISGESAALGSALERTESKINRMQARATALDALIENGALTPPDGEDPLERELRDLAAAGAVEDELAQLKAQTSNPNNQ